jgi:hypothetical protein
VSRLASLAFMALPSAPSLMPRAHFSAIAAPAAGAAAASPRAAPRLEPALDLSSLLLPSEDPALLGKHAAKPVDLADADADAAEAAAAQPSGPRVNPLTGEVNGPRGPEPTRYVFATAPFYALMLSTPLILCLPCPCLLFSSLPLLSAFLPAALPLAPPFTVYPCSFGDFERSGRCFDF